MPDFTLQQTGAELQGLINKIAPTEEKVTQLESELSFAPSYSGVKIEKKIESSFNVGGYYDENGVMHTFEHYAYAELDVAEYAGKTLSIKCYTGTSETGSIAYNMLVSNQGVILKKWQQKLEYFSVVVPKDAKLRLCYDTRIQSNINVFVLNIKGDLYSLIDDFDTEKINAFKVGERISSYIDVTNNAWDYGSKSYSYIINMEDFSDAHYLRLVALPNKDMMFAFLKENTIVGTPVYCDNTNLYIRQGESINNIPSDCKYIYIYGSYDGEHDFYPKEVEFAENKFLPARKTTSIYKKGEQITGCIDENYGRWLTQGKSWIIDLMNYSNATRLDVSPNSSIYTQIAFLRSFPGVENGKVADFCDEYNIPIIIEKATSFTIPSDCNFLYVFEYYDIARNAYPSKISFVSDLYQAITDIRMEIDNLKQKNPFESSMLDVVRDNIQEYDLQDSSINGNICIIGDSAIAGYNGGISIASLINCTGVKTDISTPGDTINGQLNKWNNLSLEIRQAVNYVFVQIGLNDIAPTETNKSISQRYQNLISKLRADAPNAKIIICTMIPCKKRFYYLHGSQGDAVYEHWHILNEQIRNLMFVGADMSIDTHTRIMADKEENLLSDYDTGDYIHPNPNGGKVIAWSWLCGYRQ